MFLHAFVCSLLLPCLFKSTILCEGVKTLYNTFMLQIFVKQAAFHYLDFVTHFCLVDSHKDHLFSWEPKQAVVNIF